MKKQAKFALVAGLILASLSWLAWVGVTESKTYYHTLAEMQTLTAEQARHRLRVGGDVKPGTIQRLQGRVDFVLAGEGVELAVSYVGRDPLPDTFVDGSQALVEGRRMPDGRFVAEQVQAKCASKYEAAPGQGQPGSPQPEGTKPTAGSEKKS